ncbi:hypothetical protein D3C71_1929300 [compost metagenome]
MVVAGRVPVERGAVVHHCAVQVLAEQTQALDQGVNRPQHRPCHIVGIDLVTTHHQQRRSLLGDRGGRQQLVDTQQAVTGVVVRFAAGSVE